MRLVVGNSTCRVENASGPAMRTLSEALSYRVSSYSPYTRGFSARRKTLVSKAGAFPAGLLPAAVRALGGEDKEIVDTRLRPVSREGRFCLSLPFSPYPEQESMADVCVQEGRGTVEACTGFGKSVAMALVIAKLQVRTLIIVPNLTLKQQLTQCFIKYFGPTEDIVVENIDSPRLLSLRNFDCLLIDEAHHVAARTYQKLNIKAWNGIFYRFFFTATPYRSCEDEQILFESIAGRIIYSINYKTAVKKGYVSPIEAYYYELPRRPVEGFTWAEVYSELVTHRGDRNRLIAGLLEALEGVPTLCLVKEIAHGNEIAERSGVAFANGQDGAAREFILEFILRERDRLIGTTGVLGEGTDTKPAEYVILAGLGKSRPAFLQQVGRVLRTSPGKESGKVIIFLDKSHKWTKLHFKQQQKYLLDEFGVVAVKLELGTAHKPKGER